jgi:trehalose 6-phosphate phosphatase
MTAGLPDTRTAAGDAGLAAIVAEPARALVAFDYDGTLAPIVARPEDAKPAPGAIEALARLAAQVGAVAIITGRPVDQLLALSRVDEVPSLGHLVVLGQYGLQRWDAATGTLTSPEPLPGVAAARDALPELLRDAPAGTTVEDKRHALVVHVRGTADPDAAQAALTRPITELAEAQGLEVALGRRVLELRPPGHDKGGALLGYAAERDARAVLFAGDDLGDLAAFDAVDHLRKRAVAGVTVCSDSPEVAALRERADLVVDGPPGVVALVDALVARLGTP